VSKGVEYSSSYQPILLKNHATDLMCHKLKARKGVGYDPIS
jgi:hypothetical protein